MLKEELKAQSRLGLRSSDDVGVVLSDDRVEAVIICSETSLHSELTVVAAEAGKHVLCEKPMPLSLSQCKEMIDAAKKSGVVYMQPFPSVIWLAAIFCFASGELAVLESRWSWVAGGPTTEIYGDKGTIVQTGTDYTSNAHPLAR